MLEHFLFIMYLTISLAPLATGPSISPRSTGRPGSICSLSAPQVIRIRLALVCFSTHMYPVSCIVITIVWRIVGWAFNPISSWRFGRRLGGIPGFVEITSSNHFPSKRRMLAIWTENIAVSGEGKGFTLVYLAWFTIRFLRSLNQKITAPHNSKIACLVLDVFTFIVMLLGTSAKIITAIDIITGRWTPSRIIGRIEGRVFSGWHYGLGLQFDSAQWECMLDYE